MNLKNTVFIIKSSPWKSAHLFRNHPEYSAIFDLIKHYRSKFRFILVGSSSAPTTRIQLKNGIVSWDVQKTGTFKIFAYYFNLMKLLFQYRPHIVIVLGMLDISPVAIYSLFSRNPSTFPCL